MLFLYTKESLYKFFIKCVLPSILSMLFISLYYLIDGIFIGNFLGSSALAAFGLVVPFVMMSFALADMIAIGSSVQISMCLGQNDRQKANELFTSSSLIIIALSCLIGALEYALAPYLIELLNIDDSIKARSIATMQVFALFAPLTMLAFALDNYLRICARTYFAMFINIASALITIVLDFIFLALLGLELEYAALATCLGLAISTILGLLPFVLGRCELKFTRFRLDFKRLKIILFNGSSEFLNNISGSLYAVFANLVLLELAGAKGVAAFSILTYIDGFFITMIRALSDGTQPALSFNHAQKNATRLRALLKMLFLSALVFTALTLLGVLLFSDFVISLFASGKEAEFIGFASHALVLFSLNFALAPFNVLTGGILTAFEQVKFSLILSLTQNLCLPLIFLLLLSHFIGLEGVWLTPLFSEFCVLFLSLYFLKKSF